MYERRDQTELQLTSEGGGPPYHIVKLSRCAHEHTELYVLGQRRNSGRKRKSSVPNLGICEDSAHPEDPAPRRRRTSTATRSTTLNPDIQAAQGDPRVSDAPSTDAPPTDAPCAAHPKSFECAVCGYYKPAGVRQCARCLSHLRSEHLSNLNITKEHFNITKEHLCLPVQAASEVHTNTHRNTHTNTHTSTHRNAGVHSRHNADSFASFTVAGGGGGWGAVGDTGISHATLNLERRYGTHRLITQHGGAGSADGNSGNVSTLAN
jgi:hypothetical protein